NEVAENVWEEAVSMGLPEIKRLIEFQKEIAGKRGTAKLELAKPAPDASLREEVKALVGKHLQEAFFEAEKAKRMEQVQNLRHKVEDAISSAYPNTFKGREAGDIFEEMLDATMREAILTKGERVDGRKPEEIREVAGEAALLPRTHGSGVFRRGETTTLSILTLGTPGDQRLQEGMEIRGKKRFMHHYNFPPYSVGEVRPLRGPGRRDIGHGMLAEKALLPVIPTIDEFPYTIRIVTEVTSSNGSSSMASACSSSLALMDAGVPITRPVAGIAVGLIAKGSEYKLLADIQGPEDHHGDMDFKVAGTTEGVTAIQMDVKLRGITKAIFAEALETAKRARLQILETAILPTLAAPRPELSEWAPRIHVLHINPDKIGGLIGPGGKMIRQIIEECEVEIDVEDDGTVFVTADRPESAGKALEWIRGITREIEVGEVFEGVVKKVAAFGAFIEIAPGQEGLVHISELSDKRVERVEDVLKHGDMVTVRVIGIDEQGKIRLSVKQAT
ncbi:MAG: polyribonucleotide nucleotidyltransferase, partial [Candidatus Pacearchaeota archaeon]|nr:polyribonucleotide nucleotidyltransferase [Candidatus Pacearchaeota archaeon]